VKGLSVALDMHELERYYQALPKIASFCQFLPILRDSRLILKGTLCQAGYRNDDIHILVGVLLIMLHEYRSDVG